MSLALWVLISASPGLSLLPNPLGEHECFSIFQGWELSTPVKAGGWFSVVTNENSTALTPLQMWQGHGANGNVLSQTKGHIFLKVQAQYDSIKLSSGPGCSKWFQVLARWWVRWGQMWGACPDQGHLPCCWQHMLCPLHLEIKQLPWTALKPLILHKQRTLNYAGKLVYFCKGAFTLRLQTFSNRYISIGSPRQESLKTIPCRNTPFQCSFIKH